jgi:5-methylcytosine-specific restriction endonuclease McrA
MGSYIYDQRAALAERHYVRKAGTDSYWFDFRVNKVDDFIQRYGENFCLILFGSEAQDDAFVMPYRAVKTLFNPANTDRTGRRWIGSVRRGLIQLSPGSKSMPVLEFYNAFQHLEASEEQIGDLASPEVIESTGGEITLEDIRSRVRQFNTRFRDVTPHVRIALSRQIARPGLIADFVKQLQNYTCQLCHTHGFLQRNGVPYIEAYHIIELHRLVKGSYCSDNLVVVCPTCRKKLRYADTRYESSNPAGTQVQAVINGEVFVFERNLITDQIEFSATG